MRTSVRVQEKDWRSFVTVATYSQPMQAEADAFKLVRQGYHVELGHHGTRMREPGRSKVWTNAEHDWNVIDR